MLGSNADRYVDAKRELDPAGESELGLLVCFILH